VFRASADRTNGGFSFRRQRFVAFQNLRIPQDRIERCAKLVTEADDIPALGKVCRFRIFFRLLQCGVGDAVGVDFLLKKRVLAGGFFLGDLPCVMGEHEKP